MKKKTFFIALVLTLMIGLNMSAYAADDDVTSPRAIVITEYNTDVSSFVF